MLNPVGTPTLHDRKLPIVHLHRLSPSEQYCQELTRREARNFYWGFVALPTDQRIAIYALYSFSRQLDDEVDGAHYSHARALVRVPESFRARSNARIRDCFDRNGVDPLVNVLSDVVHRYEIPEEELEALLEGVEMDLKNSRYETWEDVEYYCRHVASSVGRMCTRIFGFNDPQALLHADHLGIALQLTNILRDIREDFDAGRVYLPQEDLKRFGLKDEDLSKRIPGPEWDSLIRFEVARGENYFESGLKVTRYIPRRAAVCVMTMAGIYRSILKQIEADPYMPLRERLSLRKRTKIKVMLSSWLRAK
jgi:15-cis-phytoene synthase